MDGLKNLTNEELLRRTALAAQREREASIELLSYLREVDRRQLFIELGYPSLYDFTVRELKVSQSAAYRRIQTMRLMSLVPETEQKLKAGSLSMSTAAKVQAATSHLDNTERVRLLAAVEGKSTREVDREIARLAPKEKREWTRWLSGEEVQISFCLDRETFQGLQLLLSIRMHRDTKKTYRTLVSDLIKLGHDRWNRLQRTATPAQGTSRVILGQEWKTLAPRLRDEVWRRDRGTCTFVNPENGARCNSTELLQLDHIHPLALGGKNELSNLRLLCAAHNRARAQKTFSSHAIK